TNSPPNSDSAPARSSPRRLTPSQQRRELPSRVSTAIPLVGPRARPADRSFPGECPGRPAPTPEAQVIVGNGRRQRDAHFAPGAPDVGDFAPEADARPCGGAAVAEMFLAGPPSIMKGGRGRASRRKGDSMRKLAFAALLGLAVSPPPARA